MMMTVTSTGLKNANSKAICQVVAINSGLKDKLTPNVNNSAITHLMGIPATLGVFGLVGLAVLVLGERRSPVITTTTCTAALTPRRIRDYLPRRATALIPLGLVTVLGLFALGIPTASPIAHIDLQGLDAVHLPANSYLEGVSTTPDGEIIRSVFYPWPGVFYVIPVLVPLAAQLALAAAGLR